MTLTSTPATILSQFIRAQPALFLKQIIKTPDNSQVLEEEADLRTMWALSFWVQYSAAGHPWEEKGFSLYWELFEEKQAFC